MTTDKYEIIKLDPSYSEVITEFLMNHFLFEEPLNRASQMTTTSFLPFVEKLLLRTLNVPFSFAIQNKESGKIVGCAMSSIWYNEKSEDENADSDDFTFDSGENKAVAAIGRILTRLHSKLFEIKPDVQKVLHLEILSVAKEHQRRGLASMLMQASEDPKNLKTYGISIIASEISSLANQCLMKNRGYTSISEIFLNEELGSDGEQLIKTDDGTDRVILMSKGFEF